MLHYLFNADMDLIKNCINTSLIPSSEASTIYFYYGLEVKIPPDKLSMLEADLKCFQFKSGSISI